MDLSGTVRAVMARDPDGRAIEYRDRWYTWRYLTRVVGDLDRQFDVAGLGRGTPVGLVARNRPAIVASILGLIAGERCIVMIYSAQSTERMASEVRALNLPVLVADIGDWTPELRAAAAAAGTVGIALDPTADAPVSVVPGLDKPGGEPHRPVQPDIAAELLSSGTTGSPKRIPLKRTTLAGAFADAASTYAPGAADALQKPGIIFHPLGNIAGLTFLIPLAVQGQPVALLEKFRLDTWLDLVKRHKPARTSLPTAVLRMILDAKVPKDALGDIAFVGVGGGKLTVELQDEFEAAYGLPLLTAYGATEFCGVIVNWSADLYRKFGKAKRGSVGLPRPGVEIRVVDEVDGRVLPPGETGVLEAKVDRVGPDWIHTTDLASIDADGFLYIHGRADQAINRGGFKVLPEQVAAALREHPAIADVAVLGLPDARLGEVPVAALETRGGPAPSFAELDSFARSRLVAYQLPARYFVFDALPRTESMKVNLPELRRMVDTRLAETAA